MCCRYYFGPSQTDERIKKIVSLMERDYPGQYKTGEIFPGDTVLALIGENGKMRHVPAVFGFPGMRDGKLLLNARAETAAEKPTFAAAFRDCRAILPADGFFEWSRGEKKTKYLFTLGEDRTLYLCGLYKIVDGQVRFVILTRAANASMAPVHDRMPVIASADQVRAYLTKREEAEKIAAFAAPRLNRTAVDENGEKTKETGEEKE